MHRCAGNTTPSPPVFGDGSNVIISVRGWVVLYGHSLSVFSTFRHIVAGFRNVQPVPTTIFYLVFFVCFPSASHNSSTYYLYNQPDYFTPYFHYPTSAMTRCLQAEANEGTNDGLFGFLRTLASIIARLIKTACQSLRGGDATRTWISKLSIPIGKGSLHLLKSYIF